MLYSSLCATFRVAGPLHFAECRYCWRPLSYKGTTQLQRYHAVLKMFKRKLVEVVNEDYK